MTTVSIKEAKNRFTELGRMAEAGAKVVVTRNGKPAFDIVPHEPKGGINLEAISEYKKKHGIDRFFEFVAPDFDDPLPEDFLIRPSR
jgi:prevent-host-death family protein